MQPLWIDRYGSLVVSCIGKASISVQLTKRSNIEVQELAFYYLER